MKSNLKLLNLTCFYHIYMIHLWGSHILPDPFRPKNTCFSRGLEMSSLDFSASSVGMSTSGRGVPRTWYLFCIFSSFFVITLEPEKKKHILGVETPLPSSSWHTIFRIDWPDNLRPGNISAPPRFGAQPGPTPATFTCSNPEETHIRKMGRTDHYINVLPLSDSKVSYVDFNKHIYMIHVTFPFFQLDHKLLQVGLPPSIIWRH